jgi:quercetin dioxygenase-like cupin family protein
MSNKTVSLALLFLMMSTLIAQQPAVTPSPQQPTVTPLAQQPTVTSLMSKELTDLPGREVLMIAVEYPPGGADPIHRHDAHAIVYVMEGSIVMQVKGGKEVTLTPGQTFYEGPNDVHLVGRNASSTKPAKFLVFLVKNQGAPVLVPVPE